MQIRIKKDITVRFIPNLFEDKGRTLQSFPYERVLNIQDYLKKAGVPSEGTRVLVNSEKVDNLGQYFLHSGDEILVMPYIEEGTFWGAVIYWIFVAFSVGSAIYGVVSAFTTRNKMPSFDTLGDGLDEGSASASWTGVKTVREPGGSVPIIYGKRLTGGTVINEYISTDGDKNYLNSLIAIGEGPLKSITLKRINKNTASNFANYTIETRLGTNDQTVIPNFEDLHDIHALSVPLTKNNPYVYTTQSSDVEAFEIRFNLPSGLYQQDGSGNILAWDVAFQVEYKVHTDANYIDLGITTISAKSRSEVRRIFRKVGLTAEQYDIRITRTSDDSSLEPNKNGDLYLIGVDEINTDDLAYPNTGVAGVKALAIEQLSGDSPEYEFEIEGREISVPKVMNGAVEVDWEDYYWDPVAACYKLIVDDTELTWDEETYVIKYCANPIWCIYDLMINTRYGVGDSIGTNDNDLDYLLEMSQYCEEKVPDGEGGYEKRFRLDVCIDSPQKALDLVMQLADTFRALPFISDNGKIRIAIKKPDVPVQLFNMSNIIKDSFSQSWGSKRDIPNMVYVQYDNQDNYYQSEKISVIDDAALEAGKPKYRKDLRYYGTKLSYAIRYGRNFIKTAKYCNEVVVFKSGMGAAIRQCGEVIDISHDVPQWGFSGKVLADSTTTLVKLDREIVIENAKSYSIRVDFAQPNDDGSPRYEEKIITDSPGTYTEVNVSETFSIAPAEFDNYSFGESDKVVFPGRIMSLKRERMGVVEIEALAENDALYDDSAVIIPLRKLSSLSLELPNVESLRLTEGLVKAGDGTILNVIDVWFRHPDPTSYQIRRYMKAKIYFSDNAGLSWEYVGETYSDSFSVTKPLIDGLDYSIAVVSTDSYGASNPIATSPQETIQLIGKSAPPADVTSFLVNQSRDRLYMGWTGVTDVDLKGYEIRYGDDWDTAPAVASGITGNSFIILDFRTGASQSFWIKAIDTSGNYSVNATQAIITIDNIPFTNIIESYSEQTAWGGTKSNTSKVGDNLEIDATFLTGTYITPVRDIGYVATFKIGVNAIVTVSGDDTWQDFGEQTFLDVLDTLRFNGAEIVGAVSFEIKTSEDNVAWSDWKLWQAGDYKCRYFQLRMTLTRASTSQDLECSEFNYYADLPDVDEFGDAEITVAANGVEVTFTKEFHVAPSVNIDILSGDGFVHKFTTIPSITGFVVKLYDLSGTEKTGTLKYHAHGV